MEYDVNTFFVCCRDTCSACHQPLIQCPDLSDEDYDRLKEAFFTNVVVRNLTLLVFRYYFVRVLGYVKSFWLRFKITFYMWPKLIFTTDR